MQSTVARNFAFEMELKTPRTPAQEIRLYPATPQDARTYRDSTPARERLAVKALIMVTLALGGTLFFSFYQGLQHYVMF